MGCGFTKQNQVIVANLIEEPKVELEKQPAEELIQKPTDPHNLIGSPRAMSKNMTPSIKPSENMMMSKKSPGLQSELVPISSNPSKDNSSFSPENKENNLLGEKSNDPHHFKQGFSLNIKKEPKDKESKDQHVDPSPVDNTTTLQTDRKNNTKNRVTRRLPSIIVRQTKVEPKEENDSLSLVFESPRNRDLKSSNQRIPSKNSFKNIDLLKKINHKSQVLSFRDLLLDNERDQFADNNPQRPTEQVKKSKSELRSPRRSTHMPHYIQAACTSGHQTMLQRPVFLENRDSSKLAKRETNIQTGIENASKVSHVKRRDVLESYTHDRLRMSQKLGAASSRGDKTPLQKPMADPILEGEDIEPYLMQDVPYHISLFKPKAGSSQNDGDIKSPQSKASASNFKKSARETIRRSSLSRGVREGLLISKRLTVIASNQERRNSLHNRERMQPIKRKSVFVYVDRNGVPNNLEQMISEKHLELQSQIHALNQAKPASVLRKGSVKQDHNPDKRISQPDEAAGLKEDFGKLLCIDNSFDLSVAQKEYTNNDTLEFKDPSIEPSFNIIDASEIK